MLRTFPNRNAVTTSVDSLQNTVDDIVKVIHTAAKDTLPFKKYRPFLKPYWKYGQVKDCHKTTRENDCYGYEMIVLAAFNTNKS